MDKNNYLMCDDLADLADDLSNRPGTLDQMADAIAGEETRDQADCAVVTLINDPLACTLVYAEIAASLGLAGIEAQRRARFGVSASEAQGKL